MSASAAARPDLPDIQDFVAADNVRHAHRTIGALRERCRSLESPSRHYSEMRGIGFGVRMAVHRHYVILYAERGADVGIERILHGARDRSLLKSPLDED